MSTTALTSATPPSLGQGGLSHCAVQLLTTGDMLELLGAFLRLHVADGDASPNTLRSYLSNVGQFVQWCKERGLDPARATETDLLTCCKHLNEHYARNTVATKLAAVRRLYEAAVWRGLRQDNPAAGLKAPRESAEKVKIWDTEIHRGGTERHGENLCDALCILCVLCGLVFHRSPRTGQSGRCTWPKPAGRRSVGGLPCGRGRPERVRMPYSFRWTTAPGAAG